MSVPAGVLCMLSTAGRRRAAVLSIVIPTLEAAGSLDRTLEAIAGADIALEVIVADGGSADATRQVAARHGARIVDAPRGRGRQLAAGEIGRASCRERV